MGFLAAPPAPTAQFITTVQTKHTAFPAPSAPGTGTHVRLASGPASTIRDPIYGRNSPEGACLCIPRSGGGNRERPRAPGMCSPCIPGLGQGTALSSRDMLSMHSRPGAGNSPEIPGCAVRAPPARRLFSSAGGSPPRPAPAPPPLLPAPLRSRPARVPPRRHFLPRARGEGRLQPPGICHRFVFPAFFRPDFLAAADVAAGEGRGRSVTAAGGLRPAPGSSRRSPGNQR